MIIKKRIKRTMTQKEMSVKLGLSVSTIKKYISFPREDYLKEAAEKRYLAFQLRSTGLKWEEVAEKMETTKNSAIVYYRRYKIINSK